ncbi:MAG: hypothetical protein GF329_17960 [Candidatus Lokiarchaeota archaeon]|nr:hypothetical protein [Candidatus Lokiarchaeota archaeon]
MKINKKGKKVKDYLNNEDATELLRHGKPIWLGLPIYAPKQLEAGLRRKRGTFWFRVLATNKIRHCMERGAKLKSIRLNVPSGPTYKVVVDLILEAPDRTSFMHRGKFIEERGKKFMHLSFPKDEFIGSDFNRLGTYMIAVGSSIQEIDLTAGMGENLMRTFEVAHERLEKIRTIEIPNITRKLETHSVGPEKTGRLKAQLTLLHKRREHVMKEMKRLTLMVYLYVIHKTGANYAAWDGVQGISTRGK